MGSSVKIPVNGNVVLKLQVLHTEGIGINYYNHVEEQFQSIQKNLP